MAGYFDAAARLRRQAERDAAEVRSLAGEYHVGQAVGFSRGARAIVGALAEDPGLFRRVALVIPPGGTAAGKYSAWLKSLSTGAQLELLPSRAVHTDVERVQNLLASFLS